MADAEPWAFMETEQLIEEVCRLETPSGTKAAPVGGERLSPWRPELNSAAPFVVKHERARFSAPAERRP